MAKDHDLQVLRGTKAALVSYGALLPGQHYFCTDTKESFVGDGTTNVFVNRCMTGVYASRPIAANAGRFYFVTGGGTNDGSLYLDTGAAWVKVNFTGLAEIPGTLDDVTDGSMYAKVLKADVTAGHVNKVSDGTNTKTAAEIKTHIDDASKHRVINDSSASPTELWSAQKIRNELDLARAGQEYQDSVKDQHLATPPSSPVAGDRYIVAASPTGAWAGKTGQIAEWSGSAWTFVVPKVGTTAIVDDEAKQYTYNGTAWVRTGGALQTVTAGNGLTGGGTADSVSLAVGAGNGIAVASTSVSAKPGKGIVVNATGIEANIDADSIIYDAANGNRLKVGAIDCGTL